MTFFTIYFLVYFQSFFRHYLISIFSVFSFYVFSLLDSFLHLLLACSFRLSPLFSQYFFVIVLLVLIIFIYVVASSHFSYILKKNLIIHIFPLNQNFSLCLCIIIISYTKNDFFKQKHCKNIVFKVLKHQFLLKRVYYHTLIFIHK